MCSSFFFSFSFLFNSFTYPTSWRKLFAYMLTFDCHFSILNDVFIKLPFNSHTNSYLTCLFYFSIALVCIANTTFHYEVLNCLNLKGISLNFLDKKMIALILWAGVENSKDVLPSETERCEMGKPSRITLRLKCLVKPIPSS